MWAWRLQLEREWLNNIPIQEIAVNLHSFNTGYGMHRNVERIDIVPTSGIFRRDGPVGEHADEIGAYLVQERIGFDSSAYDLGEKLAFRSEQSMHISRIDADIRSNVSQARLIIRLPGKPNHCRQENSVSCRDRR